MQSVDVFHVENDVGAAYYIFHRSLVQYLMIPFIITLLYMMCSIDRRCPITLNVIVELYFKHISELCCFKSEYIH